jgi:hypothetical protein
MKITTASNYTRAHDWCLWRHLVNLIVAHEVRRQGVWLSGACSVLISSKNVEAWLWLYGRYKTLCLKRYCVVSWQYVTKL